MSVYACYCRVSTRNQKNDSQRTEIKKWLRGHRISEKHVHWYEDKESGKTLKRPAFERLQKELFSGQINTVIVWKLDRLSRAKKKASICFANGVKQEFVLYPLLSK